VPVPVGEPDGVRGHGAPVLVPVPGVVRVRPVLDVQDRVPEARLPERRVARLRLRHAARAEQSRAERICRGDQKDAFHSSVLI
jgi:hypothetical protein